MSIGIISAMPEEIKPLKDNLVDAKSVTLGPVKFLMGKIYDQSVVLVLSGVGEVQVSIATTLLLSHFDIKAVIFSGCAGAFNPNAYLGDVVTSTKTGYCDVDVFDQHMGQLPGQPQFFLASPKWQKLVDQAAKDAKIKTRNGLIMSGQQFVIGKKADRESQQILHYFPKAMAQEMEGAPVAQVARQFHVPYVVIRVMSNNVNGNGGSDFNDQLKNIGVKPDKILIQMCKNLSQK